MCVKCKHRVFFDPTTKVLYYMDDSCNKVPLPADALVGGVPIGGGGTIPPADPDAPLTTSNSCYKATGVWQGIERFMGAAFEIVDSVLFSAIPFADLSAYAIFQKNNPDIDEDNANTLGWFGIAKTYGQDGLEGGLGAPGAIDHWNEHKDTIRDDFLCFMQDAFDKSERLTDADLKVLFDYDFDTPSSGIYAAKGYLDTLLDQAVKALEKKYHQKLAYAAVTTQSGECNCTGSEPTPPISEVGADCVRIRPGVVTYVRTGTGIEAFTPTTILADPKGTKVSEQGFNSVDDMSEDYGGDPGRHAGVVGFMFELEDDMEVKAIWLDFFLTGYTDTANAYHAGWATAESSTDNFVVQEAFFQGNSTIDAWAGQVLNAEIAKPDYVAAKFVHVWFLLDAVAGLPTINIRNIRLDVKRGANVVDKAVPTLVYC